MTERPDINLHKKALDRREAGMFGASFDGTNPHNVRESEHEQPGDEGHELEADQEYSPPSKAMKAAKYINERINKIEGEQ